MLVAAQIREAIPARDTQVLRFLVSAVATTGEGKGASEDDREDEEVTSEEHDYRDDLRSSCSPRSPATRQLLVPALSFDRRRAEEITSGMPRGEAKPTSLVGCGLYALESALHKTQMLSCRREAISLRKLV